MKIQYDQLAANLNRNLAPVYLLAGEELLLIQEAEESIHAAAKKAGFDEYLRFTIDAGFDWSTFQQAVQNTSLFSEKQCIALNIAAGKFSDAGKKILLAYLEKPHTDKILIMRAGKLDAAMQKNNWYKVAEKLGVVVPIWPLTTAQFPNWIQQRLRKMNLQTDAEGLQLLAMRTEGNLLAAAQEIEKLSLLYREGHLTTAQIQESSSNNARYNVFNLIDAILQGNPSAIIHIVQGLKEEAMEPILVLWALTREARQWAGWLQAIQKGQTLSQLLMGNFLLEKRKNLINRVLQQHSITSVYTCLQHASHIDKTIKGVEKGNIWGELHTLALALAGVA